MTAERHPVQERQDLPVERRIQLLEQLVARLWDQVWWMSLTSEVREGYEREGFSAPIERFYGS